MPRMKKKKGTISYRVPAVEKSFAILEMFASKNSGYTISDVSRYLKLPISTTSSLLYTMVHCGYLVRNDSGDFTLSTKLISESSKLLNQIDLREIAQPELVKLTTVTGLASVLSVPDSNQVVCIDKVEGHGQIRIASFVGKRFPMHCTCTGKVILAFYSDEEIDEIVESTGLEAFTENTITSLPVLKKELFQVRVQGFALDNEEYGTGVRGLAAPIFDHKGKVVAAIAVGGAVFELDKNLKEVTPTVKETAAFLSDKLGFETTVFPKAYVRT